MALILLAEDSPTHTTLMSALLEDAAHDVICVTNGKEALSVVDEKGIDLVVTDLQMPEMNGLDLVQSISENRSEIPVIVVTAQGSEALAVDALALGAANFVPKNSVSKLLAYVVARTIRMSEVDQIYSRFKGHLTHAEFSFTLTNHVASIEPAVLFVVQTLAAAGVMNATQRLRVGTAISSAIFNAICYGNLEIKEEAEAIGQMLSEDETGGDGHASHDESQAFREHSVELIVSMADHDSRIMVSHGGGGRMTRMSPAPGTPESFELEQCRGLMLMTSFMDDVIFHNEGTKVVMVKNHP